MWKEVAGEGADHHTRGRACSPESFASAFGEDLAAGRCPDLIAVESALCADFDTACR
jgi:hypothetical protein